MDINKKSRADLKGYFVKNAVPTENNFRDLIDASVNQKDDGLTKAAGSPLSIEAAASGDRTAISIYDNFITAQTPNWSMSLLPGVTNAGKTTGKGLSFSDGVGAGNARLFLEDATGNVSVGIADPAGYKLNVGGTLNVTGLLTASAGLSVVAGQTLTTNGPLLTKGGVTVTGSSLLATAGVTVSGGPLLANAGATVSGGALLAQGGATISGSSLLATAGVTVSGGSLQATTGATISGGQLLANAGAVVTGGQLLANSGAAVSGGQLQANAGVTVSGTQLIANSGVTVNNVPLYVNTPAFVYNGLTVNTLSWLPPPGDPAPVMTARTVPAGQGAANESTELIVFHGNDGLGGSGPDYITLRAPGLRLQTYNDTSVQNIDNPGGSNTRFYIDPTGQIFAYGALNAMAGAIVTGGRLSVGVNGAAQPLDVYGLLSAKGGASVIGGGFSVGASGAGQILDAWGPLNARSGAAITGGGLSVGLSGAGQPLDVWGPVNARAGAVVMGGGLSVGQNGAAQPMDVWGPVNAHAGAIVTGGGLSVGVIGGGQVLDAWGPLNARAGAAVTGGGLSVGASGAGQTLDVWGTFNARAGGVVSGTTLQVNSGMLVQGGITTFASPIIITPSAGPVQVNSPLQATVGAQISGAPFAALAGAQVSGGLFSALQGATVSGGSLTVPTLTFPPPPGDPAPVITARTIPVGQAGASNEATELILFHGNDSNNGAGPDCITLRAPSIRLQTYNDTTVQDINNAAGANNRFSIDPDGKIDIQCGARSGTTHPVGLPLYITSTCNVADSGIEFRHSNGLTGLGLGWGALYATGSNTDQDIQLLARGAGALAIPSGLRVDGNRLTHIENDGALYRYNGQVYLTTDDNFFMRGTNTTFSVMHFDVTNGGRLGIGINWPQSRIDVQGPGAPRGATTHPTGLGLYVTSDCSAAGGLVEFRHNNGTQGIGFGYNTIYATGCITTPTGSQNLTITGKGPTGRVDVIQDSWQTPVLGTVFTPFGGQFNPPGYFKDSCGIVHLRGLYTRTATATGVVFQLPVGFRPAYRELLFSAGDDTAGARIDILPDGTVNFLYPPATNHNWFSLDGLTFRAA